jgi:hypothetical protein
MWDGKIDSPIPKPKTKDDGTVVIPDILKYNSPITHTYVISLFLRNGPLNRYLNKHFNNMSVRYLDKEDLFKFIKKCVIDFGIRKNETVFYQYRKEGQIYGKLRDKLPFLKNNDIILLAELIEKSPDRDSIYQALGMEKPKKLKVKLDKKQVEEKGKTSVKEFLEGHFSIVRQ